MKGPMTREIKYRCYSKRNGMNYNNTYFILALSAHYNGRGDDLFMQYTGLNDKNGKEIYEGDCLLARDLYGEYSGSIEWWNDRWTLAYKGKIDGTKQNQSLMTVQSPEVIGNIYQNPELLEAK